MLSTHIPPVGTRDLTDKVIFCKCTKPGVPVYSYYKIYSLDLTGIHGQTNPEDGDT